MPERSDEELGSNIRRYWIGLRAGVKLARDPALNYVPAGHFFSPIPSADDRKRVLRSPPASDDVLGIDLRLPEQLQLVNRLIPHYERLPFTEQRGKNRYYYDNRPFGHTDGVIYATLLLDRPPSRVIEIGSGYSSALLLDMNDLFFDRRIEATFIEPYPERLRSLARPGDLDGTLRQQGLQSVEVEAFEELERGDILFIDSTHVSKLGSDVNYLFFEILPRLRSGVLVHIHDVFFPFEYPSKWISRGIAWNEDYLLRGFLQYNNKFRIVLFNHYLSTRHRDLLADAMPMCSLEGGSFWMEVA